MRRLLSKFSRSNPLIVHRTKRSWGPQCSPYPHHALSWITLNRPGLDARVLRHHRQRRRWRRSSSKATNQKRNMAEVEKDQIQDALRAGLFVRGLGRPCSANPYPQNSNEHVLWEKGWRLVDERGENASPIEAMSRSKLVPEFTPGGTSTKARRELKKSSIVVFLPSVRIMEVLRIFAVIAMGILMLIALRW
jgi:hypothetical protein